MSEQVEQDAWGRELLGAVLERACVLLEYEQTTDHIVSVLALEDTSRPWSEWFMHAAASLEMSPTLVQMGPHEVHEALRQHGGVWITVAPDNSWLIMGREISGRVTVTRLDDGVHPSSLGYSARRIESVLGPTPHDWVMLEPQLNMQSLSRRGSKMTGPQKAVSRLRSLMLLEREALGAVFVYAVLMGLLGLLTPLAVQSLVNTIAFGVVVQPLIILAIVLLAGLTFVGSLRVMQHYVVEFLQRRLFVRFTTDLASRLPRTRHQAHEHYHMPELVNRFFDVITVQKSSALLLLDSLGLVLQMVLGMVVLAFYHPYLLAFDVVLVLIVLFVVFVMGRGAVGTSLEESDAKYAVAAWLEQIAAHPLSFKSTHGQRFARDRAERLAMTWLGARSKHFRILMRQIVGAALVQAIASAALLGLGGWLVLRGQLTLGQLVAAELIVTSVAVSVGKMGKHLETYYDTATSVHKMGKILDLPLEWSFGETPGNEAEPVRLELKQMGVNCGATTRTNLDLIVEPGERVGLTGSDNSELSALMEAIFGLRSPTCGTILFDGIAHNEWSAAALRDHIALVREVDVFEGTIEENLRLGRREITSAEIRDALTSLGLLDELRGLEHGIDTPLTAHGMPLSSDQLGRLMIARAILQQPRMILIDRALDAMHPDHVDSALEALMGPAGDWSVLVVSHRPKVLARTGRVMSLTGKGIIRDTSGVDGEAE